MGCLFWQPKAAVAMRANALISTPVKEHHSCRAGQSWSIIVIMQQPYLSQRGKLASSRCSLRPTAHSSRLSIELCPSLIHPWVQHQGCLTSIKVVARGHRLGQAMTGELVRAHPAAGRAPCGTGAACRSSRQRERLSRTPPAHCRSPPHSCRPSVCLHDACKGQCHCSAFRLFNTLVMQRLYRKRHKK